MFLLNVNTPRRLPGRHAPLPVPLLDLPVPLLEPGLLDPQREFSGTPLEIPPGVPESLLDPVQTSCQTSFE
jgi:hypothetical protein